MKILVCISNVPDTTTRIKLSGDKKSVETNGVQWIINPWDELALTRAMELSEQNAGSIQAISVVSVGDASVEPTLRKALAVGANEAIRVNLVPADSYSVAVQLAEVVKQENPDLVLLGIESSDFNSSGVGAMLAELLGFASVSSVSSLELSSSGLTIKREVEGGTEQLECPLPAILSVQKGIALEPRIPAMRGIMMARSKPLKVVEPVAVEPLSEWIELELPEAKSACKMIPEDNAKELIRLLHEEAKVI